MYGGLISAIYFVTGWTPQLITTASGDAALGGLVGTFLGVGGLLGAVLFGLIGLRVAATKIVWVAIRPIVHRHARLRVTDEHSGGCISCGCGTRYRDVKAASTAAAGAAPPIYPVLVRSGGFGAMMGVGRLGAILTPILAGIGLQYARRRPCTSPLPCHSPWPRSLPCASTGLPAGKRQRPDRQQGSIRRALTVPVDDACPGQTTTVCLGRVLCRLREARRRRYPRLRSYPQECAPGHNPHHGWAHRPQPTGVGDKASLYYCP